jgi:hypothetical protein
MDETGGDAPNKKLKLSDKAICGVEKQSSSLQKSVTISDSVVHVPVGTLSKKSLNVTFLFLYSLFFLYITCCVCYDLRRF